MSELIKALLRARMACKAVIKKEGKNTAQGYSYIGHEHVLTSGAREALLANGLVLVESSVTFLGELKYATRNGEQTCWRWRGAFELLHESGEQRVFEYEATTGTNDKTGFVASTALDRTALLRVLQLAGGAHEDPEHDINERYQDAATRPAKAQKTLEDVVARANKATAQTAPAAETGTEGEQRQSPTPAAADAIATDAVNASTSSAPVTATGELLDAKAWRDRYDVVAAEAAERGCEFLGEDEYGVAEPKWPCPALASGPDKGKSYSDPKVIGKLRALAQRPDFDQQELVKRLWILRLVARHELAKEEGV